MPRRDARLSVDERGHDLTGRAAQGRQRAIPEAVGVQVSNELAKGEPRLPSSCAFWKVEQRVCGGSIA